MPDTPDIPSTPPVPEPTADPDTASGTVTDPAAAPTDAAARTDPVSILDMVWPETGFPVAVSVDRRPRDLISEADEIRLDVDFVSLRLTPLEFIQLAASLRMSVDTLLDQHPGLQRAVIAAFDLRSDDHGRR